MINKIMGILNVTPDSFSDGGDNPNIESILKKVKKWLELGVDIIDIGGESTRPGSDFISSDEEIRRTLPIIKAIKCSFPQAVLSIDTTKYEVAKEALANGAEIINDISGLQFEPRLASLAAEYKASLVIMHLKGNPKTMQNEPIYDDVIEEVFEYLEQKINYAKSQGVEKIFADIGIGFGKTFEHNWKLLAHLDKFESLGVPLLLGISRKRFIGAEFGIEHPKDRDFETMMIHSSLAATDIEIIRVHNVEMAVRMRSIFKKIESYR